MRFRGENSTSFGTYYRSHVLSALLFPFVQLKIQREVPLYRDVMNMDSRLQNVCVMTCGKLCASSPLSPPVSAPVHGVVGGWRRGGGL